jgi:hypothetical protein
LNTQDDKACNNANRKIAYCRLINKKEDKWYYLWVKSGTQTNENGEPKFWYVHSIYGRYKYVVPVDRCEFWNLEYGHWDSKPYKSFEMAVTQMNSIRNSKILGGYSISEELVLETPCCKSRGEDI